ncbi:MAG: tRNA pseudouridine(38-40) synthase TruA [Anaerolineales bacterium]|nr:tRNA pseudouridine(38-40) synthase TruA [Anaerolineales bacterium]
MHNPSILRLSRFRATVAYDGTAYFGYQRQRDDQPTVQGELEKALSVLAKHPVTVWGAGRTDSGVHATGQVIAFDLSWRHGRGALQKAINATLPDDIAVREVTIVPPHFHPRFDARERAYNYYIEECPDGIKRPLTRLRQWQVMSVLDLEAMNEAARHLVGEHDFATFGQAPQGTNTVRVLHTAVWQRNGDSLIFSISANAFLYRMVRSIVGSLKLVGEGKWTTHEFIDAFEAQNRQRAGTTAPAHGLYLVSVAYE